MLRNVLASSALALCTTPAFADGHAGNAGFALVDGGSSLITMVDIADPAEVAKVTLANPVKTIAWRPVTGELLGIANGAMYVIDPTTGDMMNLDAKFMDDAVIDDAAMTALDFNNKIDAVRAVSTDGDNLVYFPNGFGGGDEKAGSVRRFTSLAYAEGDAMAGSKPKIFANAYTNAIKGKTAESTFQYALDAETDALVSLANNKGTLETIGKVTIDGAEADMTAMGGFDIVSPSEGTDQAYAILQLEGSESAGLYTIDLASGAATMLSDLGVGGVSGFAVSTGH